MNRVYGLEDSIVDADDRGAPSRDRFTRVTRCFQVRFMVQEGGAQLMD